MGRSFKINSSIQHFNSFVFYIFTLCFLLTLIGCDEDIEPVKQPGTLFVEDQLIENYRLIIDSLTIEKNGWLVVYRDKEDGSGPDLMGPSTFPVYLNSGNTNYLAVSVSGLGEIEDNDRLWATLHSDNGDLEVFEYPIDYSIDMPLLDLSGEIITASFDVTLQAMGLMRVDNQLISQDSVRISCLVLRKKDGWVVARKVNDIENTPESIISEPLFVEQGEHHNIFVKLLGNSEISNGDQIQLFLHEDTGVQGVFEYDGDNGLDELVKDIYTSSNPFEDPSSELVIETIEVYSPFISAKSQLINENIFHIDEFLAASNGWLAVFLEEDGTALGDLLGYKKIDSGSHENVSIDLKGSVLTDGEVIIPTLFVQDWNQTDFQNLDSTREFFDGEGIQLQVQTIAPSGFVEARDTTVSDNIVWTDNINGDVNGWYTLCRSNESNTGPDTSKIISHVGNLFSEDNPHVGALLKEQVETGETLYFLVHVDNGEIGTYEFEDNLGFDGVVASHPIQIVEATGSIIVNDQIVQNRTIILDDLKMNANSWIVVHPDDGLGNPKTAEFLSNPRKVYAGGWYENFEIELDQSVQDGAILHLTLYKDNGVIDEFEYDGISELDQQITSSSFNVLSPQGSILVENQEVSGHTLVVSSISAAQPSLLRIYRDDGSKSGVDTTANISELYPIATGTHSNLILTLSDTVAHGDRLWIGLHNDSAIRRSSLLRQADNVGRLITSSPFDIEKYPPINYVVSSDGNSGFIFNGNGFSNSRQPTLELNRGDTYTFTVNTEGINFYISILEPSGVYETYDKRVTNNFISSGIITFTVPKDAPDVLFYAGASGASPGVINIVD